MKPKPLPVKLFAFIIASIHEFAKFNNLTYKQACNYLITFGGIDFLVNHYAIEHTLSFNEVLEDVRAICQQAGGKV